MSESTSTPSTCDPPSVMNSAEQSRWFVDEVHAHDSQLKAYLRGSFPLVRDVDDVVQESYLRIWKARAVQPIRSAKAFLFKVAGRVALNRLQRERISPVVAVEDLASLPAIEDGPDAAETACTREEILLLADGIERLPPRCREIFILRRIKGVPQKQIARLLGISEDTVQVQVQRGVKRCEEFLRRRGVERGPNHAA